MTMTQCIAYDPMPLFFRGYWERCEKERTMPSRYCAAHRDVIATCTAIPVMAWPSQLPYLIG